MIHWKIGNTQMPALGFGTWKLRDRECVDAVKLALETGYRHIDTAQIYENEDPVGTAIRGGGVPRDEIFLTTKVWMSNLGEVEKSVDESLRKLKTDYVDLLLIHWPTDAVPFADQIKSLQAVQASGKTRLIGVSNFTIGQMREVRDNLGADIVCNQVEYHPYLSQKPVLDFIRSHDMVLTAYSPLARGKIAESAQLKTIAGKYNKTAGQITLRWLVQQDRVAAIPKAASPGHIRANFEIFDFALTTQEMADISALARPDGRMVNPDWAPAWDKAA